MLPWDFPAPGVGDESVPPHEQDPLAHDDDAAGAEGGGADHAMVKVATVSQFDAGGDVDPLVAVQLSLRVDPPARHTSFRWWCSLALSRKPATTRSPPRGRNA
jgi:hypothetical protein